MSVKISTKKRGGTYKSIKAASVATGIPYMTLYMRINKLGWTIGRAVRAEVRKYERDNQVAA